jgi:hypothetical protein
MISSRQFGPDFSSRLARGFWPEMHFGLNRALFGLTLLGLRCTLLFASQEGHPPSSSECKGTLERGQAS